MSYLLRIADLELRRKLDASGAVLIRGPKACGKTETARQVSQSVLHADRDESVHLTLHVAPRQLLEGAVVHASATYKCSKKPSLHIHPL